MMKPLHIETPCIESRSMSRQVRKSVWLKLENLQPSGSFKIRGIGHACQIYRRRGCKRFISSSGGNAGLAVAYAGRKLGVPVVVVVPETTTERAINLIRSEGSEVLIQGASWQEAHGHACAMTSKTDVLIHPFDDPLLWEGHASMIDELVRSQVSPDVIVLSVGGGGLLSGIAEGLARNNWEDKAIIAVETHGAASLAGAIRTGASFHLDSISSLATSLGAKQVCDRAYKWTTKRKILSAVVSDHSAVLACDAFLDDHRMLVEPACGASLATVYENHDLFHDFQSIAIIVCGGATVTHGQLQNWVSQFAKKTGG